MTDPCPDAEKAALAWELEQWLGAPSEIHDGVIWKDSSGLVVSTDMLLADLSPAAKEIARKARKADEWEPWMAAFGRLLVKYRTVRVPEDLETALEKAQAHDDMVTEIERLRAALHRPQCPSTKAVEIVDGASQTYPSRRGRCSVCDYKGPVNNSGNLWRHSSQAALKEPE